MTKKRQVKRPDRRPEPLDSGAHVSSPVEELLLAALQRGGESFATGRYLVAFKEHARTAGLKWLVTKGLRVADTSDFDDGASGPEGLGDADALVLRDLGVALIGSEPARTHGMTDVVEHTSDSPIRSSVAESFVFADDVYGGPLAGDGSRVPEGVSGQVPGTVAWTLDALVQKMQLQTVELESQAQAAVAGATWGLTVCGVPASVQSGAGIKVAVLTTGMDLGHPDFASRVMVSQSFVTEPVQDLNGHGTHMIGIACGPKSPAGTLTRYGIGHRTQIHIGKILTNSGTSTTGIVLAGMNWAIARRCEVILLPFASATGPDPIYTAAGQAALDKGLLMIAGSSSPGAIVGSPANSPTIMSVGSVDPTLTPSAFSPVGKIDIAAPGRDIFSSWTRPIRYKTISGLAAASAHVAGCAALFAQQSPGLRGTTLWTALQRAAKPLPFPSSRVGAGLVSAP